MKRLLAVCLAILMLPVLTVPAFAKEQTSFELYNEWEKNDSYPDDVTGIFYNTDTGGLAVILTDNTEERQLEIAGMVSDFESLTYFTGAHSHKELACVKAEIESDKELSGIVSVAIGWSGVTGGFGPDGRDFRVVVTAADEESVKALAETLGGRYGDLVRVESEAAVKEAALEREEAVKEEEAAAERHDNHKWIVFIVVALGVVGLVYGLYRVIKLHKTE